MKKCDCEKTKVFKPTVQLTFSPFHRWEFIPALGRTEYGLYYIDFLCFELSFWADA